jgi:hypothetical protein
MQFFYAFKEFSSNQLPLVRTTISLDDDLIRKVQAYTGVTGIWGKAGPMLPTACSPRSRCSDLFTRRKKRVSVGIGSLSGACAP